MPRGMRLAASTGGVGHQTSPGTHSATLVEPYLVTSCTCGQTFWLVTREDVLDLRAVECGLRGCHADPQFEIVDPADAIMVHLSGSGWQPCAESKVRAHERAIREKKRIRRTQDQPEARDAVILQRTARRGLAYGSMRKPRVRSSVAKRRGLILTMINQGMHPTEIAARLGVRLNLIHQDIHKMRRAGTVIEYARKARTM